jgi:membrane associated rhomboid family serine protease
VEFSYTLLLVVVTVIISFYAYERPDLMEKLTFRPFNIKQNKGEAYRFLSSIFIHGDLIHLLFNMFVLYSFGTLIEKHMVFLYGSKGLYYYVLLYFGGGLFAKIFSFIRHKDDFMWGSLGASGATMALVFSYIAFAPTQRMEFMFLPVPLPSIIFGVLILAAEQFMQRRGNTGINHEAHVFGALFGFGFTLLMDIDNWRNFIYQLQHGF